MSIVYSMSSGGSVQNCTGHLLLFEPLVVPKLLIVDPNFINNKIIIAHITSFCNVLLWILKDTDGTILTDEKLIQERWKSYFEDLLNVENPRDPMEQVEAVQGPEDEISYTEIEKAVKQMRNNKAPGPSGITAEMIKA